MRCCTIGGRGLTPGMRTRPAGVSCGAVEGVEFAAGDADADENSMRPVSMEPGFSMFRRLVRLNSGIRKIGGPDSRSKLVDSVFEARDEEFAGTWSSLIWSTIQESSSRCLVDLKEQGKFQDPTIPIINSSTCCLKGRQCLLACAMKVIEAQQNVHKRTYISLESVK